MLAQDPPLPRHPPRPATPPGECGRARLARERAARPPRALRGRTRARRQPRVTCAWPWQQRQRAPWQQWQQPAPPRPRRGCGGGVRPSRGARTAPPAPPRPSSGPALPSHLPRACPSGLCCWLLRLAAGCWLLAAGAHHVRPGGPVAQPHHNRRLSSAHGARLGPRTLPLGQSVGARPPPSPPPHLLPPPPTLPPPTFWASRYAAVERVAPDVRALLCENYAQ